MKQVFLMIAVVALVFLHFFTGCQTASTKPSKPPATDFKSLKVLAEKGDVCKRQRSEAGFQGSVQVVTEICRSGICKSTNFHLPQDALVEGFSRVALLFRQLAHRQMTPTSVIFVKKSIIRLGLVVVLPQKPIGR
jgi:hypothetical protein